MNKNAQEGLLIYREKVKNGEIKPERKNPLEKAQENPSSKALAINAKCYDCTYDSQDTGSWRTQVRNCEATACPLWSVRPK